MTREASLGKGSPDCAESLHSYPTLRAAAGFLGISPSTLSRHSDLRSLRRGVLDFVLTPGEVMRLAVIYRQRSLNEVAADLVEHAAQFGAEEADCTEEAVEAFFVARGQSEYVALYGSLMRAFGVQDDIDVRGQLEYVGSCSIRGELYSLGDWPGMVEGSSTVLGELFRVNETTAFRALDKLERFDPANPEGCKYLRRNVRLIKPDIDAWTYIYNWPLKDEPHIDHGSWSRYVLEVK